MSKMSWKVMSPIATFQVLLCLLTYAQAQGGGSASAGNVGIYNNGLSYSTGGWPRLLTSWAYP
jgi:hypothetical protein